ncbi:MAG: alpha/beta hydrolase [Leptospiraceae bacterium]|nr:alpha/beta hydrolase [Leptospiraceae bacterium]
MISLQYAVEGFNQDHLDGLILSSPGLKVKMDFDKEVKKFIGEIVASFLPDTTIDANLDLNYLSHDKSVIEAYKKISLLTVKSRFKWAPIYLIYQKRYTIKQTIFMFQFLLFTVKTMELLM